MTDEGGQFAGMMDAQSKTLAGLWSTVKDGFNQVMGAVLKPLFEFLKTYILPGLISFTDTLNAVFSGTGSLSTIFEGFKTKVEGVIKWILDWIIQNGPKMATQLVSWGDSVRRVDRPHDPQGVGWAGHARAEALGLVHADVPRDHQQAG